MWSLLNRIIRLLTVPLLLALLTGCLPETDKRSPAGSPDGDAISAVRAVSVSHWGRRVHFPEITPQLLTGSEDLNPHLRVRFNSKDPFPAHQVSFAVNGVRPRCGNDWSLARASTWSLEDGEWVLWVDLSKLSFAGGVPVWLHLRRIQGWGGKVQVWVRGPFAVVSADLVFRDRASPPNGSLPAAPWAKITSVDPTGGTISTNYIILRFEGGEGAVGFRCSLDGKRWKGCASPYTWKGLSKGEHEFRVKAVDKLGRAGQVASHRFTRAKISPHVVIKTTTPDESPTRDDSMRIDFEVHASHLRGWQDFLSKIWKDQCNGKKRSPAICRWIASHFHGSGFWNRSKAFCSVDGSDFSPCVSPLVLTGLSEGPHEVELRAHPSHKAEQVARYAWVVDRSAPRLEWTETPPAETDSRAARFSFLASEEASFTCSLDGGAPSSCESPVTLSGLTDGAHRIEILGTDAAGNQSAPLAFAWRVTSTRPTLTAVSIVPSETLTSSRTISVAFQADRPAVFHCFFDEFRPTSVNPDDSLCESPFVATNLADGTHQLHIIARDMAGNLSNWLTHEWEVDTVPPDLSLVMVRPETAPTSLRDAEFVFTAPDAVAFECSLDGGAAAPCASPYRVGGLSDGTHTVEVVAVDAAGNETDAKQFSWLVDGTPPVVSLGAISPSESPTVERTMSLSFSASESVSFRCNLDRGGDQPCASPFLANDLADGTHRVEIYGVDAAGNASETVSYSWEVYSEAFVQIDSVSPSASPTTSRDIVLAFSSTAASGYVCSLDGSSPTACTSPATYTGLGDGDHVFEVRARNGIGGFGPAVQYRWTIDATAPTVSLGTISPDYSPTPSTSISISFSASESATFYCSLDGGVPSPCASPFTATVADGSHTFSVYAEDAAGNRSDSEDYAWQVDTTPLSLSNISAGNISRTSATITWDSNLSATSRVGYGIGEPGQYTPATTVYVTSHRVDLTGLSPNTLYTYQVISVDRAGREARSALKTFRTLR